MRSCADNRSLELGVARSLFVLITIATETGCIQMSLIQHFTRMGPTGFGFSSTAESVTEGVALAGRTILVTGTNTGLGRETMRVLALRGAHVIGTARTQAKADAAAKMVGGAASGLVCELADPQSVRACIDAVAAMGVTLDAVICNAGIMAVPKLQLAHGYELQFFTNHIGHFILVNGLVEHLADTGRVVMLSSSAHTGAPREGIQFDNLDGHQGYRPWKAYGQSKLANLLFAEELARRFAGTNRTANAVHPGVIRTDLARGMNPLAKFAMSLASPVALKSVAQGAATQTFVATNDAIATVSGEYFADCNVATPRADATDPFLAERLWDVSQGIVDALH